MSNTVAMSIWHQHLTPESAKYSNGNQRRRSQEAAVISLLELESHDWLQTETLKTVDNQAIMAFCQKAQSGVHPRDKQLRLAFIGRVIEAINKQRPTALAQPPLITFRTPVSRFTPEKFEHHQYWQMMQRLWLEQLNLRSKGKPTLLNDTSLVWFGWMVWTGHSPPDWLDYEMKELMQHSVMQTPKRQYWLPPELICLIKRLNVLPPKRITASRQIDIFYSCFKQFLPYKRTYQEIKLGRQTSLGFVLPPFLVDLLYGHNLATNLSPTDTQRVMLGLMLKSSELKLENVEQKLDLKLTRQQNLNSGPFDVFLVPLRKALNTGRTQKQLRQALHDYLEEYSGALDVMNQLIVERTLHLIRHGGLQRKNLRVSTIRRYIGCFYSRLIKAAEGKNVLDFNTDEWQQCYETVLKKSGKRGDICQNLRDFHDWLVTRYGIEPIDFSSIDGFCHVTKKVHAKVLSPLDVDRACDLILASAPRSDTFEAQTAVMILKIAFYCGLRRNEVLYLRLKDLHGTTDPYLVITHHRTRHLKTDTARRQLPLKALLPLETLDELLKLRNSRLQNEYASDSLLFASQYNPNHPVAPQWLICLIQRALRQVTGDEEIVFHTLRHSFANWSMIRIAAAEEPELLDSCPVFKHPYFNHEALRRLRSHLLPDQEPNHDITPDRRGLYAISAMMGHSEPGITLTSYIHLHGWLTARHQQRSPILLHREVAAWLLNKHPRTTYKCTGLDKTLYGDHVPFAPLFSPSLNKQLATIPGLHVYRKAHMPWPPKSNYIHPQHIVDLVTFARKKKWDPTCLLGRGFTPEQATQWLQTAQWIESLKSQKPTKTGAYLNRLPKIKPPPNALKSVYLAWISKLERAWQLAPELSTKISFYLFQRLVPREHHFRINSVGDFETVISWLINTIGINPHELECKVVFNADNENAPVIKWRNRYPEAVLVKEQKVCKPIKVFAEIRILAEVLNNSSKHPMAFQVFEQAMAAVMLSSIPTAQVQAFTCDQHQSRHGSHPRTRRKQNLKN